MRIASALSAAVLLTSAVPATAQAPNPPKLIVVISVDQFGANLFDEYRIGIAPVIAGKGRYLFPKGIAEKKLELIASQPLMTGGVVLKYKPS